MSRGMDRFLDLIRSGHLDWFEFAYLGDWVVATSFWFLGVFIDELPVFQRTFSLPDPLISFPHTKQQIGGYLNNVLSFLVPLAIVAFVSITRRSTFELHHGILGLWTARGSSRLITEFLKNRVGRLRPDFLARCQWDETTGLCTGKAADIFDGRKSFPSGHSSTAFCGMTFLFLWMSARTVAWCFRAPIPPQETWIFLSRQGRIALTLVPVTFATWVAITRVEDYRHHKEDVVVGSLIGIATGTISYLLYWPNPFSYRNHKENIACQPRRLYKNIDDAGTNRINGYELASIEEGSR